MLKQDQVIKTQAIQREYEQAERRKREPSFSKGDGNTIVGSIFDCNRAHFERLLKGYWDKLYVGWNPFKNEGRGCWEVWQQPTKKTPVLKYYDESEGTKIYTLEYQPNDFEHWVADLPFLTYKFIEKLRSMDAWENKQQVSDHDHAIERHHQKLEEEETDNIKQIVQNNHQAFRDLLDYTQSGYNPLQFFSRK